MQIVIDIEDSVYHQIKQHGEVSEFHKLIIHGTPLPKGHGMLVDMSEVLVKLMQYYDGDKTIGQCLDEVHTVIDAARK